MQNVLTHKQVLTNSPLGKSCSYISEYAPELLFPVPRTLAREPMGLKDPLPFTGYDLWTGYELSWLNAKGKPQIAIIQINVPCTSLNIVESKSLKLYLNSFNQSKFTDITQVMTTLERDLSRCAIGDVKVSLLTPQSQIGLALLDFPGVCLDDLDVTVDHYEVEPTLLKTNSTPVVETLYTHLLKSNCRATGQPDWGGVFIRYEGPQIDRASLLKYVISYRNHVGFHEDCVERMFCDLTQYCHAKRLTVYARYTRRGGLDINPFRSNFESTPPAGRHVRQ